MCFTFFAFYCFLFPLRKLQGVYMCMFIVYFCMYESVYVVDAGVSFPPLVRNFHPQELRQPKLYLRNQSRSIQSRCHLAILLEILRWLIKVHTSLAYSKSITEELWNLKSISKSCAISLTNRWNSNFLIKSSVLF